MNGGETFTPPKAMTDAELAVVIFTAAEASVGAAKPYLYEAARRLDAPGRDATVQAVLRGITRVRGDPDALGSEAPQRQPDAAGVSRQPEPARRTPIEDAELALRLQRLGGDPAQFAAFALVARCAFSRSELDESALRRVGQPARRGAWSFGVKGPSRRGLLGFLGLAPAAAITQLAALRAAAPAAEFDEPTLQAIERQTRRRLAVSIYVRGADLSVHEPTGGARRPPPPPPEA